MNGLKAIETEYKGYRFRSRLEARWAVFFDACGVKWEYEPEGYDLGDGTYYLPDFLLHGVTVNHAAYAENRDIYVEVKGQMNGADADKIKRFAEAGMPEDGMYSSKYALSGNVACGHCGNIYRRVTWYVGDTKPVVWRCVSRLTPGEECVGRSVPEEELHAAIASAVNMTYANRDDIIPVLKENIESVVGCDVDEEIEVIDNMIRKSQMDLLDAGKDEARIQEIGERIVSLRERRQDVLTQAALKKDKIDRIKAMIRFIEEQTGEAEYSEILVRRMAEKVTIHDDRITVEFKSGLAIDVDA